MSWNFYNISVVLYPFISTCCNSLEFALKFWLYNFQSQLNWQFLETNCQIKVASVIWSYYLLLKNYFLTYLQWGNFSSDPSKQSLIPLQVFQLGKQAPSPHWYSAHFAQFCSSEWSGQCGKPSHLYDLGMQSPNPQFQPSFPQSRGSTTICQKKNHKKGIYFKKFS